MLLKRCAFWFFMPLFLLLGQRSTASHSMGSDLTYQCLGGNTYQITLSFYRDCVGVPADGWADILVESSCYFPFYITLYPVAGTGQEITPICSTEVTTCNGGTYTGIQEYVYTGTVTLPGPCADWTFSYNLCCRNAAITNINLPSGSMMYVFATLDNTSGICNNSPVFSNKPVPFVCLGQQFCFNHGAYDPDGDSLVYQMITPLDQAGLGVTYLAPFNALNPLSSSPAMTFNPSTGDICMTPTNLEVTVMAVLVNEYRNGVLIGSVERDIQVTVINCSNIIPSVSGINGTNNFSASVCAGSQLCFNLFSSDADAGQNTTITWDYSIPGATFVTTPGTRESGTFCWTPAAADISTVPYCFTVTVQDDNCPYAGSQTFAYCINVNGLAVNAGPDVALGCTSGATQATLNATITGVNGPYTYSWSSGQTTSSITVGTGTYIVTATGGGCTGRDTVVVAGGSPNPVADFAFAEDCTGTIGTFTDQSSVTVGGISAYQWNFGDGTTTAVQNPTHTYSAPGTYNVTLIVQTPGGCSDTITQSVTLTPELPTAAFTAPPVCLGSNTSFTDQSVSNPAITTWQWIFGDGATSGLASPTHAYADSGTYNVLLTITNAAGCTSTVTQPVVVHPLPAPDLGPDISYCDGGSTTFTATGGGSYAWTPGGMTDSVITVNPSTTTSYTVTVTNAQGCSGTSQVDVIVYPLPVADFTISPVCFGAPSVFSDQSVSTQTISNWYWTFGDGTGSTLSSPSYTYSDTGTYNAVLTVTTADGCTSSVAQPAIVYPVPTPDLGPDPAYCDGGSATFGTSGGVSYAWTPGGITDSVITVNPSATTAYTVIVTNAQGCTASDSILVTVYPLPIADAGTDQAVCFGASATLTASGGVSYDWQPIGVVAATTTITPDTTSDYTVLVTDANGCTDTDVVTVVVNDLPVLSATADSAHCNGAADGVATSQVTGGTGPYNYTWSPSGGSAAVAVGLTAGAYSVIVTDVNGCSDTAYAQVNEPAALSISASATDVACNGFTNGTLSANAGGGIPGYTYTWSPGNHSGASISALPAGTYTVTATDYNGCTITTTTIIQQPTVLQASASAVPALCNGSATGSVSASVNGGTAGYTYNWLPGNATTANVSGLAAGLYNVTVLDANGCLTTASVNVTEPTPVSVSTGSTAATCGVANGSVNALASGGVGGYTYNWTPGGGVGATVNGLYAGGYTVTATDANGCTSTQVATISNTGAPVITASVVQNVSCFGGADGSAVANIVSGNGPFTYSWPGGVVNDTVTGLRAGTYPVTVTDVNGCSALDTVQVIQPTALSIITGARPASCAGYSDGSASFSVSGGTPGYQAVWSPGGHTGNINSGIPAGVYSVTVTDAHGCTILGSATVTQPQPVSVSGSTAPVSCNGGSDGQAFIAAAGGTGPYEFDWLPSGIANDTASGLAAGQHIVTITDSLGCITSDTLTVTQPDPVTLTIVAAGVSCSGAADGVAAVTAAGGNGGYQYLWSNNATSASLNNVPAGLYTVTVTDLLGCTATGSAIVDDPFPVELFVEGPAPICIGQEAILTASASGGTSPFSFTWNEGTVNDSLAVTLDTTTTFSVVVTDANGCSTAPQEVEVVVYPPLQLSVAELPIICGGDSALLSAEVTGGNGGPYTYSWNDGAINGASSVIQPLNDSLFVVIATDGCSPPVTDSVYIDVHPLPVVQFTPENITGCTPVAVDFSNLVDPPAGSTYAWDLGDNATSTEAAPSHTYVTPGTYDVTLTITSDQGCVATQTIEQAVQVWGYPQAGFQQSADTISIFTPVVEFSDISTDALSWEWNFGDGSTASGEQFPVHHYADSGNYVIQLIVTSEGGCPDTVYGIVRIEPEFTLYIPNAFTPNGDGKNDGFIAIGEGVLEYNMWIIDRWGREIFYSNRFDKPWDGSVYGGDPTCQNDVYEYVIDVLDIRQRKHRFIGHVTLVR